MRKFLVSTGTVLLAVALLMAGSPAQAGEFNLPDPAGDATGVFVVESTPRPSEEEVDILGVKYTTTANELQIDVKMAKVGVPVGSIGFAQRVGFTHSGVRYHFLHQVTDAAGALTGNFFALRQGSTEIPCKCSGKINGKTATLEIRADIASLSRALKSFNADSAPIGPGTEFTALTNSADRVMGVALVAVDYADAAPEATLKF